MDDTLPKRFKPTGTAHLNSAQVRLNLPSPPPDDLYTPRWVCSSGGKSEAGGPQRESRRGSRLGSRIGRLEVCRHRSLPQLRDPKGAGRDRHNSDGRGICY